MKGIAKFLRSLFTSSSAVRSGREDNHESVSLPPDEERRLALQVRREVEDGRLFLRPGLTLADVAAKIHQEVGTLERVFTRFIGNDFCLYLDELRIAYVAVLYMGNEAHLYSVEKIGVECGFADHFSFCDACMKLTGMTPEMMGEFIRSRKTLKGLFLNQPIYQSALQSPVRSHIEEGININPINK